MTSRSPLYIMKVVDAASVAPRSACYQISGERRAVSGRAWTSAALLCLLTGGVACALTRIAASAETAPAAGYIVTDLIPGKDGEEATDDLDVPLGFCLRDGKEIDLEPGMPIRAGDVVTTRPDATVAIAFQDSSVVTLRPDTRMRIVDYDYPAKKTRTNLALEEGKAFFSASPRPEGAAFAVKAASESLSGDGARFELNVVKDAATGGWTATIGVTRNAVTLNRTGATSVDVMVGQLVTMTVKDANVTGSGATGVPVVLQKRNLTREQMKDLERDAAVHAEVEVGKKDNVTVKCTVKNWDGSVTKIELTDREGERVQLSTVTKGADGKKLITYDERCVGCKTTIRYFSGQTKTRVKIDGVMGKITIKDKANGRRFRGDAFLQKDGSWLGDATAKDGTRMVQHVTVYQNGTKVDVTTVFQAGATEGIRVTTTTRADGSYERVEERVTVQRDAGGNFVRAPGSVPRVETRGPSADQPPLLRTPSTLLIPEPPPVSR